MNRHNTLSQKTVVITGASSGVGRAAALAFAEAGAHVVLAARRQEALDQVAAECRLHGSEAEVVLTDVGDPQAMKTLAAQAIERFGGIDVWINNAGVGAVGEFTDTPLAAHERVIRTNLMGTMNGAYAVLPHFKERGAGVLINTLSVGSWAPAPYSVAYSASKFGLRGFSEALRGELGRHPGIHVCDVFPAFLDTPGIAHAGNYTGRELKPIPPLSNPRRVARAMVKLAQQPRDAVTVGASARAIRLGHFLAPGLASKLMARGLEAYFRQASPVRKTAGNLFEAPSGIGSVHGDYGGLKVRDLAPIATGLALLGAGVWALSRRRP
ncbi:SDR family oxidoreductase [Aquabacterium sp.]|uniref:SDR family oxidoreductase n=1 Tax=Aquabacterium sp. TaxID=1872578 RepID=UPI003D6C7158